MAIAATGFELISLPEAKQHLMVGDDKQDPLIQEIVTTSSEIIDDYFGRDIITRGALTEFHTFWTPQAELYTLEWPIVSVTEVSEDIGRAYAASSVLTVTTDYIVSSPSGKLIRVSGSGRSVWQTGFRAVRVQYTAGYANIAAVPRGIRDACRHLVALKYREAVRKDQGVSGKTDDMGNITRFGSARLTAEMKRQIDAYRPPVFSSTGERDS